MIRPPPPGMCGRWQSGQISKASSTTHTPPPPPARRQTPLLTPHPSPAPPALLGRIGSLTAVAPRFSGVVLSPDEEVQLAAVAAAVQWICKDVEASVGPKTEATRHALRFRLAVCLFLVFVCVCLFARVVGGGLGSCFIRASSESGACLPLKDVADTKRSILPFFEEPSDAMIYDKDTAKAEKNHDGFHANKLLPREYTVHR